MSNYTRKGCRGIFSVSYLGYVFRKSRRRKNHALTKNWNNHFENFDFFKVPPPQIIGKKTEDYHSLGKLLPLKECNISIEEVNIDQT